MPIKKNKSSKNKSRKTSSKRGILHTLFTSSILLFFVFIITLFYLWCLWEKQDNESIFLFILIAFIIYMQQKNMIIVLGLPLVLIHILILLRNQFRNTSSEGFVNYEKYDPYLFQEWVKTFIKQDDKKYREFTSNIHENYGSLSEMIDNMLDYPITLKDESNIKYVNELKDYMLMINLIPKTDKVLYDNKQVKYIRNMIKQYQKDIQEKTREEEKKKEDEDDEDEDAEDEGAEDEGAEDEAKD